MFYKPVTGKRYEKNPFVCWECGTQLCVICWNCRNKLCKNNNGCSCVNDSGKSAYEYRVKKYEEKNNLK